MGVCVSIINKFLTKTFTLTEEGLIQAINKVKNILLQRKRNLPKYHFLCTSEYNLLLEMHIIINFHDENSSIRKVFEFLCCEYTCRYFFDFLLNPIRTNNDIHRAVKLWYSDRDSALTIYGHINFWDTSNVTNMNGLFKNCYQFNEDISEWNVSNVTSMMFMFRNAFKFNQPLEQWNVSKVTNMAFMFLDARKFNQPLEQWNVCSVTNMNGMFLRTYTFNHSLSKWNILKLKHIDYMFYNARAMSYTFKSDFINNYRLNINVNVEYVE